MDQHRDRIVALAEEPLPPIGYLVVKLDHSRDFWDDSSLLDEVWASYEHMCGSLVDVLAAAWGPSQRIDLADLVYAAIEGDPTPLADELAVYVPHVYAWHFADRTVCVGVGQHDKEFPVMLIAAAGVLVDG
jgi:hypothetical protein